MDLVALWNSALGEIELSISRANFITWFKNTSIQSIDNGCATIITPNGFAKEWIEKKCATIVLNALQSHNATITTFRCILTQGGNNARHRTIDAVAQKPISSSRRSTINNILKKAPQKVIPQQPQKDVPRMQHTSNHTTFLNPRYTFDNFVVGQHNELAHAACRTVSESLGTAYNPLFIYGDVGLGKTHLLQSIGNAVVAQHPHKRILYTSSERFTSELIDSIHNNTISDFKKFYQTIDLLIIDDVQFLAGKEKTQDEFFHIFNFLYQQNKQIIISSDRPPHAIATLEDRLRSRFEGGMIADISQPDFETRVAILQKKAEEKDIILPEDAARYIAKNIASNIRELEGALNKVAALCTFQQRIPSLHVVEEILAPTIINKRPTHDAQSVITIVAEHFNITPEDILGKVRKKTIVYPRQIAMFILRNELTYSYPEIATHCGGRDHTTVMHACRKIEKTLTSDTALKKTIDEIRKKLRAL